MTVFFEATISDLSKTFTNSLVPWHLFSDTSLDTSLANFLQIVFEIFLLLPDLSCTVWLSLHFPSSHFSSWQLENAVINFASPVLWNQQSFFLKSKLTSFVVGVMLSEVTAQTLFYRSFYTICRLEENHLFLTWFYVHIPAQQWFLLWLNKTVGFSGANYIDPLKKKKVSII